MATDDLPGKNAETYLGDGAYVRFDGYAIMLRAPRDGHDDIICLEPLAWQTLRQWIDRHSLLKRHMDGQAISITCPRCRRTSYNLNDVFNRYCGHCHQDIPS